jgi:molybdenum cofactor synthesis domain-containing protein
MMTAAVLTVSDSAKQGTRPDLSGPALVAVLKAKGFHVIATELAPDDVSHIQAALIQLSEMARFVVTTGGTGIAPRDTTPEATRNVCDKLVPGIAEVMRSSGLKRTPYAALSRAICGARGQTLILNVPGSPKGAVDSLEAVIHLVPHALDLLAGKTEH